MRCLKNRAGTTVSWLQGWNEKMINIIRELIGMKKHMNKQGMICVSAQELELILPRTTQC